MEGRAREGGEMEVYMEKPQMPKGQKPLCFSTRRRKIDSCEVREWGE